MTNNKSDKLVMVYQLARVGSFAVFKRLQSLSLNPQHIHYITCPSSLPQVHRESSQYCRKLLDKNADTKVITIAREPISRNLSRFWRAYFQFLGPNKVKSLGLQHANDKFVEWLDNGNIPIPYDPNPAPGECLKTCMAFEPLRWFDREFKPTLGIDVYDLDSPKNGPVFYEKGNINLLITRTEDLRNAGRDLTMLLDRPVPALDVINSSFALPEVKKKIKIPKQVLDKYYNTNYTRHFYTDEEIAQFYERWST